jgi:hypothetical protein
LLERGELVCGERRIPGQVRSHKSRDVCR